MLFINPENEYPRFIGDLQIEHPDWQVGDAIPEGWTEVAYATEYPTAGENEKVVEVDPTVVDGVLTQTYVIEPMTEGEIAWRDAPKTAKAKLIALGLTDAEISAITRGLIY